MIRTRRTHPASSPPPGKDWSDLSDALDGKLFTDQATRLCYAEDASIYEQVPLAVVCPKHATDCVTTIEFCQRRSLSLIPRAAGTSLAGQCVGDGLVLDVTRYMDAVLEIDADARLARVQPGLVPQRLNEALQPHGLHFPIDPSTADRCTLGGMAGNNAWGPHILRDGTLRDHIIAMEAILADGSQVSFGALSDEELSTKRRLATREGEIYRSLIDLVDQHRGDILRSFPDPARVPNNMGYTLDRLALGHPWNANGPAFNLAPFLCGSEGTLAIITELTLRLSPKPSERILLWGEFLSVGQAIQAVPSILDRGPVALELLDRSVIQAAANHTRPRAPTTWTKTTPEAVLLIELESNPRQTATEQAQSMVAQLTSSGSSPSISILDPVQAADAWALRRAGLGLLMGRPGPVKAVTGIEDCAVAPTKLPRFAERVEALMAQHGVDCVYYGSVGAGLIHLRPWLNLDDPAERHRLFQLQSEVATLVAKFDGSLSAKHGVGRLRAHLLKPLIGPQVHPLLRNVKAAFDPENRLNPGKIVDADPPDRGLRSVKLSVTLQGGFDWGRDLDLRGATGRCNGAAVCLQRAGRGVMCPSYMATRDERDTTRGRANVLRHMLAAPDPLRALSTEAVEEVLDLCLACKGCKAECPAGVDMARIKAEALHHRHSLMGIPFRARLFAQLPTLSRWGSKIPSLVNILLASRTLRRALGLDPHRPLPRLADHSLTYWWKHRPPPDTRVTRTDILVINDPFTCYFTPEVGIAAIEFLEWAGYRVQLTDCLSSGRTQISQGLLQDARKALIEAVPQLYPAVAEGIPVIGLEPSELLTFRDEAADLIAKSEHRRQAQRLASVCWLFEEWVCQIQQKAKLTLPKPDRERQQILVHAHCHQKALSDIQSAVDCLKVIPGAEVSLITAGCCGMAGSFGYEREHATLSRTIGELSLLPAARAAPPGTKIVASGFSCRQQLRISAGIRAKHPAELLRDAIYNAVDDTQTKFQGPDLKSTINRQKE
ncbi:MAG: FAD-linked oxidase C-terminal domain-containing protein [Candidatus Thiodiazotropha sp.]